jgi:hypothetical protein
VASRISPERPLPVRSSISRGMTAAVLRPLADEFMICGDVTL